MAEFASNRGVMKLNRWLAVFCLSMAPAALGQPRGILDVGSERANRAVVTVGEVLPELTPDESDMTRQLRGVLADLRGKGCGDPSVWRNRVESDQPVGLTG